MITRLRIFGIVFVLLIVGLLARLFFWQVIKASDLTKQGQLQYQRSNNVSSNRGSIFASDGSYLTTNENDWTVFATKSDLKDDTGLVASRLSPLVGMDTSKIVN